MRQYKADPITLINTLFFPIGWKTNVKQFLKNKGWGGSSES